MGDSACALNVVVLARGPPGFQDPFLEGSRSKFGERFARRNSPRKISGEIVDVMGVLFNFVFDSFFSHGGQGIQRFGPAAHAQRSNAAGGRQSGGSVSSRRGPKAVRLPVA